MSNGFKIISKKSAGNQTAVLVAIFKDNQEVSRKSYLVKPGKNSDANAVKLAEKELEAGGSAYDLKKRAEKIKQDEALLENLLKEKKARDKDTPGAFDKLLSLFK